MCLEIIFKVIERFYVCVHSLFLAVGDKDHTVHAFQDQLPRSVVINLAGNSVEMESRLKAANSAQFERHKVEKQSTVGLGRKADQLALCLRGRRIENMLEIRRLTAESRTVVNDLAVDLSRCVINESHFFNVTS